MLAIKTSIGQLDERIVLLQPNYATGGSRPATNEDKIESWSELAEVWGKVTPFTGDEAMIAERLTETNYVNCEINYRTDIEIDFRFVVRQQVYAVVSIPPGADRKRRMILRGLLIANEIWT